MLHGVVLLAQDGRTGTAGLETQDAQGVMWLEWELGTSVRDNPSATSLDLHSSAFEESGKRDQGSWSKGK